MASHKLNIKELVSLLSTVIADMIRGRTAEELRRIFNVNGDFGVPDNYKPSQYSCPTQSMKEWENEAKALKEQREKESKQSEKEQTESSEEEPSAPPKKDLLQKVYRRQVIFESTQKQRKKEVNEKDVPPPDPSEIHY